MLFWHLAHLVVPNERVAAHQGRRGDHGAPAGCHPIGLVRPQGIVVTVGFGHVTEGVDAWTHVAGHGDGVGLRDAYASAQPGDALVGDCSLGHELAYYMKCAAGAPSLWFEAREDEIRGG